MMLKGSGRHRLDGTHQAGQRPDVPHPRASRWSTTATSRASSAPAATRTLARTCSPRRWRQYAGEEILGGTAGQPGPLRHESPSLPTDLGAGQAASCQSWPGRRCADPPLRIRRPASMRSAASTRRRARSTSSWPTTRPRPRARRSRRSVTRRSPRSTAAARRWSGKDTRVTASVPALSVSVWKAQDRIAAQTAAPATTWVTSPQPGAVVGGRAEISAALTENAFAQVTFAVRPVGTSSWRALGTDDNAPYRVFDDVSGLAKGTLLEYRAITKDSSGNVSAASSYGVVGDPAPAGGGGGGASGRSPSPTTSACPEATTRRWVAPATGSRTARRRSWRSTPRTRSGRASSPPSRRVTTSTRPRSTRAGTRTTAPAEPRAAATSPTRHPAAT